MGPSSLCVKSHHIRDQELKDGMRRKTTQGVRGGYTRETEVPTTYKPPGGDRDLVTGLGRQWGRRTDAGHGGRSRHAIQGADMSGGVWRVHRWDLTVLRYHEIMVIYPYPFLVVITQFFSCIIFINDCICILTGSPGSYILMIIYVILKMGVTRILHILSTYW